MDSAGLFDDRDDDFGPAAVEDPGKRPTRTREDTLALAAQLQAAEPDITHADVARRLGITPSYYRKLRNDRTSPAGKASTDARKGAPGPKSSARMDALANKLCDPMAKLAMGLAFALPTVAAVLMERGEVTARAIVDIAADHPRMLAALEKVSTAAAATELVQTGAMILIAASLDTGRMPAEHPVAALTGVAGLYARVHPESPAQSPNGAAPGGYTIPFPVPGPPRPGVPSP